MTSFSVGARALGERASSFSRDLQRALTGRHGWIPFALVLLYYSLTNEGRHDLVRLSGFAVLVLGLIVAQRVPGNFDQMLQRLRDRGVLVASDSDFGPFRTKLHSDAEVWARRAAWLLVGVMLVMWVLAVRDAVAVTTGSTSGTLRLLARLLTAISFAVLLFLELLGAYVAGYHLGRMASFGLLGRAIQSSSCVLRIIPGHPDGAAGLKPVGDFYFFQSMLASLPAVYLAAWSIVFALRDVKTVWRDSYLFVGLPAAIALEILAFFLPLSWFHTEMSRQKQKYLREADHLSHDVADLLSDTHPQEATPEDRLSELVERYTTAEGIPTWPVDAPTRRRFGFNNLVLASLPLAGRLLGGSEFWDGLSQLMRN
jgi:hypothetical protein